MTSSKLRKPWYSKDKFKDYSKIKWEKNTENI